MRPGAITREDILLRIPVRLLFYRLKGSGAGFSDDISDHVLHGGAGSGLFTAIQIAAYMGASRIVLLGADFGVQGRRSHFCYFGQPRHETAAVVRSLYEAKYTERVKPTLKRFRDHLASRQIDLVNASVSTADDVLCRRSLAEIVKAEKTR